MNEHQERRRYVETHYSTDAHGLITSPGKFEGEPLYVPAYWDMGLEGMADEDDGGSFVFELNDAEWDTWPELKGQTHLVLWEDSQGFVYCDRLPADQSENERRAANE